MTATNRTAYPRLDAQLNHEELVARYTLTENDSAFIQVSSRGDIGHLVLAMLLKARQDFECFPAIEDVHLDTVAHLASQLGRRMIALFRTGSRKQGALSLSVCGQGSSLGYTLRRSG